MSSQRRKGCPYLNANQARSSLRCLSDSGAAPGVIGELLRYGCVRLGYCGFPGLSW
jgi:hypothetical protein